MNSNIYFSLVSSLLVFVNLCFSAGASRGPIEVSSPNGKIKLKISLDKVTEPNLQQADVSYSIQFDNADVILDSPLGLEFADMPVLRTGLSVENIESRSIDQTWKRVWGKCSEVKDACNEIRLTLKEDAKPHRQFDIIFRAYDGGVAFRYYLPKQQELEKFKIKAEHSLFRFAKNHKIWAANYGRFVSPQEEEFFERKLSDISPGSIYGAPLLIRTSNAWVAITEANLTDWAGMYLTGLSDKPNTLCTLLSPHPDNPNICVESRTARYSPWRVIMIAPQPGELIESNIIANLNPPCEIADTSWIKPGKCAWDWWWCGRYAPDVNFTLGPNNETMKYFIDFAAEMGWEYQLVDVDWYGDPFADEIGGPADPNRDITKSMPGIDIPYLVEYAGQKDVRLFIWLHWFHVNKQLDEAFSLYEKWGVTGVKIDFMNRDDQQMVNFYHRVVKKAAEHHLLVDFHGAYKPTGFSRTYPNLMTREGVKGNEYNKWSTNITPDHCLTVPFTRMLAGPMDFTPGGFRHATRKTFKAVGGDAPAPMVYGTRAFQLAMMVVYESPLQVLCDTPYEYRKSPAGLDFLKIVPTTWDRTRVLNAQVGDYITVARCLGGEWFVGSMTDWTPRSLEIPLDFLGEGKYQTAIWSDALDANDNPANLSRKELTVTSSDALTAEMAPGGGYVIYLKPIK